MKSRSKDSARPPRKPIVRALSAQLSDLLPSGTPSLRKVRAVRALSGYASQEIINCLSYTHLQQLVQLDDPLKRAFYEAECVRGNWSIRELKRQIATLHYERSVLSKDKAKLAALVRRKVGTCGSDSSGETEAACRAGRLAKGPGAEVTTESGHASGPDFGVDREGRRCYDTALVVYPGAW